MTDWAKDSDCIAICKSDMSGSIDVFWFRGGGVLQIEVRMADQTARDTPMIMHNDPAPIPVFDSLVFRHSLMYSWRARYRNTNECFTSNRSSILLNCIEEARIATNETPACDCKGVDGDLLTVRDTDKFYIVVP